MRKLLQIIAKLVLFSTFFAVNAQIHVVNDGLFTVKEGQLVYINGNLSNYSSDFLNQGNIGLTGNFLNEVRVKNPGIGIFRFIGFQEQTLTLYDTLDVFNIEIDNPYGMTLNGITHLHIHGNMNFWDGIVHTTSESLLFFKEGASTSNANSYSYIDGPALKSGINDFVFPLGKGGNYRPAAISALTSASTFQMEYFDFPYFWYSQEFNVLKVNDQEYWDLQRISGSSYPKLSLIYDETTNIFNDPDNLEIVYWDDQWKIAPSDSDGVSSVLGLTTIDYIPKLGYFTTAQRRTNIPAAAAMNSSQKDCKIDIEWVMPPGTMVPNYEIEFSYDSIEFTYVGEVSGDTAALSGYTTYEFTDPNLHEVSKVFYRIKLIAAGPWGAFTYSPVISIYNKCIFEDDLLYPNPVSSSENLKLQVTAKLDAKMPLEIWDAMGHLKFKQTLELNSGKHIYEIKTKDNNLISGTYFIYVNPRKNMKFIVISN